MLLKTARRVVIFVIGMTVVGVGVVLLFTPGPACVVIPAGLAILGTEFAWARHWLKRLRKAISSRNSKNRNGRAEAHRERVSD